MNSRKGFAPARYASAAIIGSSKGRRCAVMMAAIPVILMLAASLQLTSDVTLPPHLDSAGTPFSSAFGDDDGSNYRPQGGVAAQLADRTSVSGTEVLSTFLSEWNYFVNLNPDIWTFMKGHLRGTETKDTIEAVMPVPSLDAPDVEGTYVPAWWQEWLDALWSRMGLTGPKPSLDSLCKHNIMLRFAPWCSLSKATLSEWLLEDPIPTDSKALRHRAAELRDAISRVDSATNRIVMQEHDRRMIAGIRWTEWKPSAVKTSPRDVSGEAPAGSVFLRRTSQRYPVLLALRRDGIHGATKERGGVYDKERRLNGFHACMFGSRRNLSSTIGLLRKNLIDTLRPQRLHVVTSADGIEEYQTNESRSEAESRSMLFNSLLSIVSPIATSVIAIERNLATRLHHCVICRGFLPREICRASFLADIERGIPAELVMIFRPDMFMWNPVYLVPFVDGREVPFDTPDAIMPQRTAAVVDSWRLHTSPAWSLVVDKGFLPTTFGVYNDINITRFSVVVHCRVTFPLDLHWIGDPVVIGHWSVMSHWLECFSVITSSTTLTSIPPPRLQWIDDNAGETHHAAFYQHYLRPLFEFAAANRTFPASWRGPQHDQLDLKVFDFQFSLFRSDPIVNAQLMSLTPMYVAYQQQTIFRKFATKWEYGECMRYYFTPRQFNVSSFYYNPNVYFFGEIGRVKMIRIPQRVCSQVRTPPGIQTCFAQYQRIVFYKKGKNIHNPCKPYCGVFPLILKEGVCAHVGNKGPRQRYISTFSMTPMFRNESGEVLRFNLVNPQYVRGDTLWFEKQRAREEATKEREEKEKAVRDEQQKIIPVVAAAESLLMQRTASDDTVFPSGGALDWGESIVRPVPGNGDAAEAPQNAKKSKKYRFVRGK